MRAGAAPARSDEHYSACGPRVERQPGIVVRSGAVLRLGTPLHAIRLADGRWHVDDTVRALLGLMKERAVLGEIFNVGGEEKVRIKDVA